MTNESEVVERLSCAIIELMAAGDIEPSSGMAAMSLALLSTCAANGIPKDEALRVIAANADEVYENMESASCLN